MRHALAMARLPCRNRRPGAPRCALALHTMIERVPLHRFAARLLDQPANLLDGQHFRRLGAGVVVDQLVPHRAVDVVGPVGQRDLGRADRPA